MERPRCGHCRNPIKDHQAAVGPSEGDRTFHEDCWTAAHPGETPSVATVAPVADRPVAAAEVVEQRSPEPSSEQGVAEPSSEQGVAEPSSEQRDYERSIASGGLAALLSPYVKGLPAQRNSAASVPA